MKKKEKEKIDFTKVVEEFSDKKLIVIGDMMVDEFVWGTVNRISPEAPVPVVNVTSYVYLPGGAANVVNNIHSLGATVYPIGVVGEDREGKILIEELKAKGITTEGIVIDKTRPTTLKTRIIGHSQQIVRVDREKTEQVDEFIISQLISHMKEFILQCDGIIISDYAKGIINSLLIKEIRTLAKSNSKFVIGDPKLRNFRLYREINLVTPNDKEAAAVVGVDIHLEEDIINNIGFQIKDMLEVEAVLITRGEKGMSLFEGENVVHIPTTARQVYDVTGAGDTVVAVLGLCKAVGLDYESAARLANIAAGIVVEKIGTAVVTKEELIKRLDL